MKETLEVLLTIGLGLQGLGLGICCDVRWNMQRASCKASSASRLATCCNWQWPGCGRPSNTFTHPAPYEAAKLPKPTPCLNSVRSILVNNTISSVSYVVLSEGAFEGLPLGLEGWKKALERFRCLGGRPEEARFLGAVEARRPVNGRPLEALGG